jgi:AraC-like DNA-binding protein
MAPCVFRRGDVAGNNVTIPAHYHGCIEGVTLALMGVAYDVLPRTTIAKIAAEVGDESEASFSRTFKRCTGLSPGAWRSNGP